MVICYARSARAAIVLRVFAAACLIGVALCILDIYKEMQGGIPWPADAALSAEGRKLLTYFFAPLIGAILLVASVISAKAAPRFSRGAANLIMTDQDLRFPVMPGFRACRKIEWADVGKVEVFVPKTDRHKRMERILESNSLFFGSALHLRIDLKKRYNVACKLETLWRIPYIAERIFFWGIIPKTSIIESICTDTPEEVVRMVAAFKDDPELRRRYGGPGVSYIAVFLPSGELTFELDTRQDLGRPVVSS